MAYAGFCECCTLVFNNIVFPQTSEEIWNSFNSFVNAPCLWEMESGFDPLKVKVGENPAWVALGGEVPSLTIPFQLLKRY